MCGLTQTSFVKFLSPNPRLLLHSPPAIPILTSSKKILSYYFRYGSFAMKPGRLYILISIPEAAINRQLKELYDYALPNNEIPPSQKIEGARKPLMTGYLINHRLKIHLNNDNVTGLYANIECSTVSLSVTTNSVANEMPPVRLRPSSKATKAIS